MSMTDEQRRVLRQRTAHRLQDTLKQLAVFKGQAEERLDPDDETRAVVVAACEAVAEVASTHLSLLRCED